MRDSLDVVRRRNILRLIDLIDEVPDGDRRRRLRTLLAEEEASARKGPTGRG
jgi:hypothetical protein